MAISQEQQNILNERNANIYERYCNLCEQQPLAYRQTIITYLSKEYELSPQMIKVIIQAQENKRTHSNENN